jgi:hypothetical protein
MKTYYLAILLLFIGQFTALSAQTEASRISQIETRIGNLERRTNQSIQLGSPLLLFGAFCALWAQNTGRSSWLWFFLGVFFSVITIFFLLTKNANDIQRRRTRESVGK